jgi:predicted dehydrogenase
MKNRLRLGLLGTGLAAHLLYLPALRKLQHRIEIVACASRRIRKTQQFTNLIDCPLVVESAEELFSLDNVQAVLISLPIDVQPQYVRMALRAGKAVLSEKPVAPSVAEGKLLLKACARFDAPWLVGENYHFMPHVQKLLQWIKAGRLGNLRIIEATQINKMDRKNPYFHTGWRRAPAFNGGFVVDGGVHLAHLVRLVAGMPEHVVSHATLFDPQLPPVDSTVALLKFPTGLLGTWTSCFAAHHQGSMLRVFGSRGFAELGWDQVTLHDRSGKKTVFVSPRDSFVVQFEHFADVVLKGARPAVTAREALADLSLMQAIVGV